EELDLENLENFRLVDLYSDVSLENSYSLTLKFIFRDMNKTLEEAQVAEYIDKILQSFKEMGLELR
ncbi:hypothetical protein I7U11_001542, partial [Campylobacter coli]|nr:hypothetical protein [Campylobacter coli]